VTDDAALRRRSRQLAPRPKVVQFSLTQDEFDLISEGAASAGLARGAFAAEVTLAAARGVQARSTSPLREALGELMAAASLVRRMGTNLNQAVAGLNATGQPGADLLPAAEFCVRVIRRLDEAAEEARRNWSSDRDAFAMKPHQEGRRVGQVPEPLRGHGPFRDEPPVAGRDPRQQVFVADDQAVEFIHRDGPGAPKGVTHPADRGNCVGEAEALAKSFSGVN
jgi:hypothetical protein